MTAERPAQAEHPAQAAIAAAHEALAALSARLTELADAIATDAAYELLDTQLDHLDGAFDALDNLGSVWITWADASLDNL